MYRLPVTWPYSQNEAGALPHATLLQAALASAAASATPPSQATTPPPQQQQHMQQQLFMQQQQQQMAQMQQVCVACVPARLLFVLASLLQHFIRAFPCRLQEEVDTGCRHVHMLLCVAIYAQFNASLFVLHLQSGLFSLRFGQKFGLANFHACNGIKKCRSEFGETSSNFTTCVCQNCKGQLPPPVQSHSFLAVKVTCSMIKYNMICNLYQARRFPWSWSRPLVAHF